MKSILKQDNLVNGQYYVFCFDFGTYFDSFYVEGGFYSFDIFYTFDILIKFNIYYKLDIPYYNCINIYTFFDL